ncbi:MAG: flagellar basal body P-ring formation protein FlgA [Rhodobacteraceae bacterium]|nr:flagellar basal body P-ring formation protein FlgA [Paracoccaceae bacterium]
MIGIALSLVLALLAGPAAADSVVAARTLRSNTVVGAEDLRLGPEQVGALRDPSQAIGRETVNHIFAGQAIRAADLGPAALVERNQLVILSYSYAGLNIVTEARALERGAIGAHIRVMNLASRSTVTGVVMADGSVSIPPRRP